MKTTQTPKVALITGAARRIGAEIAKVLHSEGFNVIIHYHESEADASLFCESLNNLRHQSATMIKADLSKKLAAEALVHQAAEVWGHLDVVINNASRFYKTHLSAVTETQWDDLIDSNLKAPFFIAQAAIPYLRKNQGCIVNIGDIHAERPVREYPVYCISKAGLIMLTKALAKELGPDIRVNAVSPGAIIWPEGENDLTDLQKQKILDRIVLSRHGHPHDIAKAVLYFVRDADYVTGQIWAVDGGRSLIA